MQCRICGAPHVNCGPVSTVVPLSLDIVTMRGPYAMTDLKEYSYINNGVVVTAKLTADDAKRLGATALKSATATATTTVNPHPGTVPAKARTDVHTAARTVENKGR